MKRLLLLRHAQALPAEGGSDIDRALSPKGLSDALALGQTLKKQGIAPDHILCSSAKRTRMTCEKLLEGLEANIHTVFTKDIYSAGVGELFQMTQSAEDKVGTLMLIGHNPTIYELAVRLSTSGNDSALGALAQGYAPASLSVIETDIENWAKIDPNACSLTTLMDPLDYNAPAAPTRWT